MGKKDARHEAGRLAGWLAMMMKLLLSSVNPFLPSVVQQQLKKQYTKEATNKESIHLRNQQQQMWVPQSEGASEEGKTCICVREEKGGFDAPMRNHLIVLLRQLPPLHVPPTSWSSSSSSPSPLRSPTHESPASRPSLHEAPFPPAASTTNVQRASVARPRRQGDTRCRHHRGQRCGCPKNNNTL
jgi:hypothetical protein